MELSLEERIAFLEAQKKNRPEHTQNIEAIIRYYKDGGKLPGVCELIAALNGKATLIHLEDLEEFLKGHDIRDMYSDDLGGSAKNANDEKDNEEDEGGTYHQSGQDPSNDAIAYQQMAQSAVFPFDPAAKMHKLWAQFCLPSSMGGLDIPQNIVTTQIYNDTGSSIQSIRRQDWVFLNVLGIPSSIIAINEASRTTYQEMVYAKLRIVKRDQNNNLVPLTDWLTDCFVITDSPNASLLSGSTMRNHLYFATAPGNHDLYVSVKKHGLVSQLPVV